MELVAYLNAETHIPTETLSPLVHNLFVRQEVKKYDLLLKAKSHSQKLFYVEEGLLRAYYTKKKKDITHNFFMEKMFYLPVENIYYGQPSPFFLETLEESTVWVATFPEVERVVNEHQELERLMRLLLVSAIKSLTERLYTLKFQTAQERYDLLLKNYPQILLRAPLGHIASLLGITQQTLSVIRGNK
nr:cyclic nucleotide-binding domain-containing protein [uncultured Capnocytophaga sp.]